MKMVKRILVGLAVLTTAFVLAGCGDVAGIGQATGTKYNKTYSVDGTDAKLTTKWRRYVKQIGSKEEIAEIKTTITIYKDYAKNDPAVFESKVDNKDARAVIGFIVDYNKNADDATVNDFVVFGYRPANDTIYLGPYSAIKLGKDVEMDTDNSSLVDTTASPNAQGGTTDSEYYKDGAIPAGCVTTDKDGNKVLEVSVKQPTKGTYEFYLGSKKLGSWKGKTISDKDPTKGMAIGGVAGYINVPKGAKVKVNYKTDSEDVTGTLFADEE